MGSWHSSQRPYVPRDMRSSAESTSRRSDLRFSSCGALATAVSRRSLRSATSACRKSVSTAGMMTSKTRWRMVIRCSRGGLRFDFEWRRRWISRGREGNPRAGSIVGRHLRPVDDQHLYRRFLVKKLEPQLFIEGGDERRSGVVADFPGEGEIVEAVKAGLINNYVTAKGRLFGDPVGECRHGHAGADHLCGAFGRPLVDAAHRVRRGSDGLLQSWPVLGDNENVLFELPSFVADYEMKAIGQEALKHWA